MELEKTEREEDSEAEEPEDENDVGGTGTSKGVQEGPQPVCLLEKFNEHDDEQPDNEEDESEEGEKSEDEKEKKEAKNVNDKGAKNHHVKVSPKDKDEDEPSCEGQPKR